MTATAEASHDTSRSNQLQLFRRMRRRWLVALVAPVVVLTASQISILSRFPAFIEEDTSLPAVQQKKKRLAVVNFVDSNKDAYLWGIYSIHHQLKKFHMVPSVDHVVLIASDMKQESKSLLKEWLGDTNVLEINKDFVRDIVPDDLWIEVFSKIEFFNLTTFDKIIALDNDILIRSNIMHWFDYPAPAATQSRGTIEWNSGAMVIEPNAALYNTLLEYIPRSRRFDPKWDDGHDTWNCGHGHQGFLSSFFLSNVTNDTMFTMSYGASVVSSDLMQNKENEYFLKYRPWALETVHMTHKPWKESTRPNSEPFCMILREWADTVADAPRDKLRPLPDYLQRCRPMSDEVESNSLLATAEERARRDDLGRKRNEQKKRRQRARLNERKGDRRM